MAGKLFVVGKDLTSILVYTGARSSVDGTVTWTLAANRSGSLSGVVDYVTIDDQRLLEMIASVDDIYANYELTLLDSSITLGEILTKFSASNAGPVLPTVAEGFQYVKAVFVRGLGTYTYRGTIRHFSDGIRAFGKNACELTLAPLNTDGSSPLALSGS